jgi:hypothetical protein
MKPGFKASAAQSDRSADLDESVKLRKPNRGERERQEQNQRGRKKGGRRDTQDEPAAISP